MSVLTSDNYDFHLDILRGLAAQVDFEDGEEAGHATRVGRLAQQLALSLGLSPKHAGLIRDAAPLHDIGKIAIPNSILQKRGPLTPSERRVMERHALFGWLILDEASANPIIRFGAGIARHHHERWDGTGYPDRLRGEEIPLEARIVAVADVFDALTSDRPYRKAVPRAIVEHHMRGSAGTHFDPDVIEAFFGPAMAQPRPKSGEWPVFNPRATPIRSLRVVARA
jgi:putative two-component system response regulator